MKKDTPDKRQYLSNTDEIANNTYQSILSDVAHLLIAARQTAARTVNSVMTTTYWEIGRRIVEFEQGGQSRAEYGEQVIQRLSTDLTQQFGRGFSVMNLRSMRRFYLEWPLPAIQQTVSVESAQELLPLSTFAHNAQRFPLPWSHYVLLMTVSNPEARTFFEIEAIGGGWTVRQLDRQLNTMFYERTALSRNKAALLTQGEQTITTDQITPEEEIKDPYVLEFLDLKDEYSESDLEQALIEKLSTFLLELGDDFAFIG